MQIAICDDEKTYLDFCICRIKGLVAREENNCELIIDAYSSGEQLIKAYEAGKEYDLVLLDIKMQELSGFDVARIIRKHNKNILIIFISSLGNHILNSFEYHPFWFLVKPVTDEKFVHVFKKAASYIMEDRNKLHSFYTQETGLTSLEINKILYLESRLRKVTIYTRTQTFTYYANLKEEQEKLKENNFVRSHKGYLVNMAYIHSINKNNIVLKSRKVVPLSEHRHKEVFDCFTDYIARC